MVGALVAIGGSIVTGLLGGTARQITIEAVKMAAWRLLLAFLVWVALPIVLYNVLVDYLFDIMTWAMTQVVGTASMDSVTIQITGMAGWIGSHLNLDQALAMILAAVATRFAISFIPFIGK